MELPDWGETTGEPTFTSMRYRALLVRAAVPGTVTRSSGAVGPLPPRDEEPMRDEPMFEDPTRDELPPEDSPLDAESPDAVPLVPPDAAPDDPPNDDATPLLAGGATTQWPATHAGCCASQSPGCWHVRRHTPSAHA